MISTQNDMNRRLAEAMADGMDTDEAADAYLGELDPGDMIEMLRPLVVLRAKMLARATVRRVEARAFVSSDGHVRLTVVDEMRRLLEETFALGDGTRVRWADATPEQHRARAEFLRWQADSIYVTAERHERAATIIESAGAQSLAGVDLDKIAA